MSGHSKHHYDIQRLDRYGNWVNFSVATIGRPQPDPFETEGQAERNLKEFLDSHPLHREDDGQNRPFKVEFRIVRVTPTKRFAPGGP